ncbi:hypothetical protein NPIL_605071 [Nephila pilipes]|uniref:Uncharacterized protein n=1 Tax=Nephila pilipes TaxID=299642 RepID=A0A8X6TJG1_NEPPI|nr:hypothetical protein NPIL_605071 [Nephila pilipes]
MMSRKLFEEETTSRKRLAILCYKESVGCNISDRAKPRNKPWFPYEARNSEIDILSAIKILLELGGYESGKGVMHFPTVNTVFQLSCDCLMQQNIG